MILITLTEDIENKYNPCIYHGWIANKKLKELEYLSTLGLFTRFHIDYWIDSGKRYQSDNIKLNKFLDAVLYFKNRDDYKEL